MASASAAQTSPDATLACLVESCVVQRLAQTWARDRKPFGTEGLPAKLRAKGLRVLFEYVAAYGDGVPLGDLALAAQVGLHVDFDAPRQTLRRVI